MGLKIRNPSLEEFTEIVSLVSQGLSYPNEYSVDRDFPLLFSPLNYKHLWVYASEDGDTIYSHAGSFFTSMYIDNWKLPVGGIGGVATQKDKRGQGFAGALLKTCLEDLKSQGAALAFLWTGDFDFYRKFGFELVGRQWFIYLPKSRRTVFQQIAKKLSMGRNLKNWELLEGKEHVLGSGKILLDEHILRVERTEQQFIKLLSSPKCRILAAKKDGALQAYLVIGKGVDLRGHIHEWAGSALGLSLLVEKALFKEDLVLLSPHFTFEEAPLIYELEERGFPVTLGYMSMVKLLDFFLVRELAYKKVKHLLLCEHDLCLEKVGTKYRVGLAFEEKLELSEREVLRFFFGPEHPSYYFTLSQSAKNYFDALFPLRLWWWGLDSV